MLAVTRPSVRRSCWSSPVGSCFAAPPNNASAHSCSEHRCHAFIPVPQELAKFQAFLQKQGATQLSDMVRGRQRLAYPIKR